MEKRILQVRKLSDALRVRLKDLKKSDADLLLNLDEEELLDMYKVTQLVIRCFTVKFVGKNYTILCLVIQTTNSHVGNGAQYISRDCWNKVGYE